MFENDKPFLLEALIDCMIRNDNDALDSIVREYYYYHSFECDLTDFFISLLSDKNKILRDFGISILVYIISSDPAKLEYVLDAYQENAGDQNFEISIDIMVLGVFRKNKNVAGSIFERLSEFYGGFVEWLEAGGWASKGHRLQYLLDRLISKDEAILMSCSDNPFVITYINLMIKFCQNIDFFGNITFSNLTRPERLIAAVCLGGDELHVDKGVPDLIEATRDQFGEIRLAAFQSLRKLGMNAVPAIVRSIRHGEGKTRDTALSVLQELSQPTYEMLIVEYKNLLVTKTNNELLTLGIGIMGDQAFRIMKQLRRFRLIGEFCKKRGAVTFKQSDMENIIEKSKKTVANDIRDVSEFFRSYFHKAEGRLVPQDDDESMENPDQFKLFERGQGKRGVVIYPLGWRAWELTCQYLDSRDNPQ